jgi:sphingolipid 4-desaturase/C4-monooxygenase
MTTEILSSPLAASNPQLNLSDRIGLNFMGHLVSTPAGRAHLLTLVADSESNDEGRIFAALAQYEDPWLAGVVKRHSDDEARHAALLEARIVANGAGRPVLPESLDMLGQLDAALDGLMSRPISSREDVMRAYLLLQVLEERAVSQLPLFVEAFAQVDPETSAVFATLLRDEQRHLGYCHAIARRYAPSLGVHDQTLTHFRQVEARVFAQGTMTNLAWVLERGMLDVGPMAAAAWQVLSRMGSLVTVPRTSGFTDLASDQKFTRTSSREPHLQRRRALLAAQPEIRKLFGFDRRTIAVTVAVVITQLAAAWLLQRADLPLLAIIALAWGPGAILSHWLGQSIHETAHNLAARTRLANRAVAWLANVPLVLPIAETFHRYHLVHHVHLGVDGVDSDLPVELEVRCIGKSWLSKLVWLALYPIVYLARGASYAKGVSRGEVLNAVAIAAINFALWHLIGPTALLYLGLSMFFAHGLHPVAAHFVHEHYLFAGEQETYSYYGPLNLVTFNVGYHVEHHDFMNIPGWRLPEYRALTDAAYRDFVSHRSWTGVLWEFITRTDLGPWSRLVRNASART